MGIGVWQLVLILAIVILLFGARKLPSVAGDVAKAIKSFKGGMAADSDKAEETVTKLDSEETGKGKDKATQS